MKRNNFTIVLLLLVLSSLFLPLPSNINSVKASGTIIHVPDDYLTIQEAIDNADPGDIIYIYNGTYPESVQVYKTVTLQGQDKTNTFIDGTGTIAVNISSPGVTIKDLTIFNATGGVVLFENENLMVSNCNIGECSQYGIFVWGSNSIYIEDCQVYDNGLWGLCLMLTENVTVQDCGLYDSSDNSIYVWNSDFLMLENCSIYENDAHGVYITESDDIKIANCSSYGNTYSGIFFECTTRAYVSNSTVHSNLESGIWVQGTNWAYITRTEVYNNTWDGLTALSSDFLNIEGCCFHENNDNGIAFIGNCDYSVIKECNTYWNSNSGVDLYNSHTATLCKLLSSENSDGLSSTSCNDLYVSRSEFSYNTFDGIKLCSSECTIVNTNMTDNDSGASTDSSETVYRYCCFEGNFAFGVTGSSSQDDARYCWWGDSSGPYHSTENPGGLGDEADSGVVFSPWQASIHQPDALISDLRCQVLNTYFSVIYPDQETPKPLGRSAAMVSDWLASAFMTTKIAYYVEGLDTEDNFVNQTTGNLITDPRTSAVCFGGPAVNVPVYYYESNKIAPVIYDGVPGARGPGEPWSQWYLSNGTAIAGAAMGTDEHNDIFLIECFQDPDNRTIVIAYGIGWKGTYAAGKYFEKIIFPGFNEFLNSWIIVKWEDTDMNGYVNNPDIDTYTLAATG